MRTKILTANVCMLLVLLAGVSWAETNTNFTNTLGDNDFNNAANWDNGLPSNTQDAVIKNGLTAQTTATFGTSTAPDYDLIIGADGTLGRLIVSAGNTVYTGNNGEDVKVGVGAGSVGYLDLYGTVESKGTYSYAFVGDAAGGVGHITVYDGGELRTIKGTNIINGSVTYYPAAVVTKPKDRFWISSKGKVVFHTDGANIATVTGSDANGYSLQIGSGATLEIVLGGEFHVGDSWTLFSGVNTISGYGSDGTGVFGNVYGPGGAKFMITYTPQSASGAGDGTVVATLIEFNGAKNPVPASGSVDVDPDTVLKWDTGAAPGITKHLVYMSKGTPDDPNFYLVATLPASTTEYDPSGIWELQRDRKYSWRVDEKAEYTGKDPNLYTGAVWTFATSLSVPTITPASPDLQFANVGDNVEITTTAINPFTGDDTGLSYQWYKGISPDTSTPVGTNSNVLTLNNVQVGDEGDYYCRVTVAANSTTADSDSAHVVIKRLVGHWKLDGNMADSANSYDGTYVDPNTANPAPTPVYTTGIDGQAFEFADNNKCYIQINNSVDNFNFYPYGFTVSAWIKTTQIGYGAAVSKQDRGAVWKGFLLSHNSANAIATVRQLATAGGTASVAPVNDDQWHLMTGTYNHLTGIVKIYVDGKLINQSNPNPALVDTNTQPLLLGAGEVTGVYSKYVGLLDDVRIWNYEVDPVTIAYLYSDITGKPVCIDNTGLQYDFNGDCIVNLEDFAMFTSEWLNCRQVPDCVARP